VSYPGDLRTLLRLPRFRRLFAIRITSQLADGAFQVSLAAYVVFSPERQTTPTAIATALAVLLLPYSLIGPFAGVLLDRWRRRQVLYYCGLLRAALAVATAGLLLGAAPDWLFYTAALLMTAVNRFVLAGLSAALPRVVPPERLVLANSVTPTAGTLAATLGGASVLLVQLLVPPGDSSNAVVVLLAGACYAASTLIARALGRDSLGPEHPLPAAELKRALAGTAHGLRDGLRHLRERPSAATALAAVTAMRLCYGVLTVTVLMLCRYTFNDPDDTAGGMASLGLALGLSGAGFFVAALLAPWAARRFGLPGWITRCAALAAVLAPALALTFAEVPLLVAAFVQSGVDDDYRGRVFAVYDMLYNCAFVAAAALAALILPADGRSVPAVLGVAVLYALTAAVYGRWGSRPASRPGATTDTPSVT
jgi:MFS family permease